MFDKHSIKTLVKSRLQSISTEVETKFKDGKHTTSDEIDEKIAIAIADAFEHFVKTVQVQMPTQTLVAPGQVTLANGGGPAIGTVLVPQNTGNIV